MKRINNFMTKYWTACWLLGILVAFVSCQNDDIDSFDTSSSYIYFDIPYLTDANGENTTSRSDSISYSFALDDLDVTYTTLNVVVKTIGMATDYDRPYNIELINETTTATSAEWDQSILNNRSIKAGELTDTIHLVVQRSEELQEQWMQINLRILPNENFQIGYGNLQTVKVSFSDILSMPSWWPGWAGQFGPFYREVYLKWIEIYYEGADPNTNIDNGEPLYWDNMPSSSANYTSWYPVLAMYLTQLKEYFEVNTIYPDGDESLPPIKLP